MLWKINDACQSQGLTHIRCSTVADGFGGTEGRGKEEREKHDGEVAESWWLGMQSKFRLNARIKAKVQNDWKLEGKRNDK